MNAFRVVDTETWPRRRHFELFLGQSFPYLAVTAEVEVGYLLAFARKKGFAFFDAVTFCVLRAANDVEEFRCRIVGDEVRLYERVDVSFTLLAADSLFRFAECPFDEDFTAFARRSREVVDATKQSADLAIDARPDLIYATCLPWIRFGQMTHPVHAAGHDSTPRFAWGKFVTEDGGVMMPLNVQVHHGLVDGLHLGRFYERFAAHADALAGR